MNCLPQHAAGLFRIQVELILLFGFQDHFTDNMTITDAVNLALRTLKQVMEEKLNSSNVEVMIMTPGNLFQMYTKAEVEKFIEDLQ